MKLTQHTTVLKPSMLHAAGLAFRRAQVLESALMLLAREISFGGESKSDAALARKVFRDLARSYDPGDDAYRYFLMASACATKTRSSFENVGANADVLFLTIDFFDKESKTNPFFSWKFHFSVRGKITTSGFNHP
ncbi:MAG: hypothetical protein V4697_03070 [Patescibacteria group bacterium]